MVDTVFADMADTVLFDMVDTVFIDMSGVIVLVTGDAVLPYTSSGCFHMKSVSRSTQLPRLESDLFNVISPHTHRTLSKMH